MKMTKRQRQKATQEVLTRIVALNKAKEEKPFTLKDVVWVTDWKGDRELSMLTVDVKKLDEPIMTSIIKDTDKEVRELSKRKHGESVLKNSLKSIFSHHKHLESEVKIHGETVKNIFGMELITPESRLQANRERYKAIILGNHPSSLHVSDHFHYEFKLPTLTKDKHFVTFRDVYLNNVYTSVILQIREKVLRNTYEQAILDWLDDTEYYYEIEEKENLRNFR